MIVGVRSSVADLASILLVVAEPGLGFVGVGQAGDMSAREKQAVVVLGWI